MLVSCRCRSILMFMHFILSSFVIICEIHLSISVKRVLMCTLKMYMFSFKYVCLECTDDCVKYLRNITKCIIIEVFYFSVTFSNISWNRPAFEKCGDYLAEIRHSYFYWCAAFCLWLQKQHVHAHRKYLALHAVSCIWLHNCKSLLKLQFLSTPHITCTTFTSVAAVYMFFQYSSQ